MKAEIYCDECNSTFVLDELKIEESTLKRAGKIEKVIVQYFRCPDCGHKYIVVVYADTINKMNEEYAELLKHHDDMSPQKFKLKSDIMKRMLAAEEAILIHLYQKQHKDKIKPV